MSSVAAKRLAEALKWEFWSNGNARSKTIRITLSPGLANDVRLSSDRYEAKGLNTRGHAPVLELCRELVAAHLTRPLLLRIGAASHSAFTFALLARARVSPSRMIGTVRHGFEAARGARKGMSEPRL
jgi:hypothetical protein